jgi:hypothetical protein
MIRQAKVMTHQVSFMMAAGGRRPAGGFAGRPQNRGQLVADSGAVVRDFPPFSFRCSPDQSGRKRAETHFDWTLVKEPGPRFENMVALHLLKWVAFQEDTLGLEFELRYFRDIDGREVDFVILEKRGTDYLCRMQNHRRSAGQWFEIPPCQIPPMPGAANQHRR